MNKVETIQGFKARKWNTTILIDGEKTIVFEEWFVDELPPERTKKEIIAERKFIEEFIDMDEYCDYYYNKYKKDGE